MPRSSGTYSAPAGTLGTTLTPISSTAYNAFVNDLVADANAPRPVTAGGTGSSTPADARTALGATATGSALFTAADAAAGRTALGATATGSALVTAADAAAGRTALGATATGSAVFTAADAAAGRTALGATATGSSVFTATDAAAGRTALGLGTIATQAAASVSISGGTITGLSAPLPVASGGTGRADLAQLQLQDVVINGAFDVWQRATSSTSAGYVAADRWRNSFTGGTVTQSRQAVTVGTTFGVNNPAFFLRQGVSGQSGSNFATTEQRIEDVRTFAGQTVTVLGWAKRNSGTGNLGVRMVQNFGTGGSPSTEVAVTQQTVTLTTSWAPFAVTFAVPSVTGKTLGTNGNSYLSVALDASHGGLALGVQTVEVDLWGVHVRPGTLVAADAASYVAPPVDTTLGQCQRFYRTLNFLVSGVATAGSQDVYGAVNFPFMRAAPSIVKTAGTFTNCTAPSPMVVTTSSVIDFARSTAAGVFYMQYTVQADSEL